MVAHPPSTRTPQPQEAVLPLVLFILSPRGNPPPPHWSRVLHHNGGPYHYKSCVLCVSSSCAYPRNREVCEGVIGEGEIFARTLVFEPQGFCQKPKSDIIYFIFNIYLYFSISILLENRVGDDDVPAVLQYRPSDLYPTDRKETMAILQ